VWTGATGWRCTSRTTRPCHLPPGRDAAACHPVTCEALALLQQAAEGVQGRAVAVGAAHHGLHLQPLLDNVNGRVHDTSQQLRGSANRHGGRDALLLLLLLLPR
jgi:hypothetical protein